jgi:hypothetical protein
MRRTRDSDESDVVVVLRPKDLRHFDYGACERERTRALAVNGSVGFDLQHG